MKNGESQVLDLQLSLRLCKNLQTCQRESQIDWWLFNFLLGTTSMQQWSVHMHLQWLTQKRWRTGFTMKLIQSSKLSSNQIHCFSSVILMQEYSQIIILETESLAPKALGNITAMDSYYCDCAPHIMWWTQTLSFTYWHATRHHGCIWGPNTGIWLTTFITRKKDAKDIRVTKAMCGTDCWTDHRLILSKVNLKIAPKRCS